MMKLRCLMLFVLPS